MSVAEIVREISNLPRHQQFEIQQALNGLMPEEQEPRTTNLAVAAQALVR